MKAILSILIIAVVLCCSCHKHHDKANLVPEYCNGLVTDTTGTNDTARIYMPSAFTPDADGLNDICRPIAKSAASISFTLYDANDVQVFTSTTPAAGFSPPAPPSTYTEYHYKIQITTLEGNHIGECGKVYALSCLPANLPVVFHYEDELNQDGFDGSTLERLHNCP